MMGVGRGKQEKYGKMGRESKKKEEVKEDVGIQREGETTPEQYCFLTIHTIFHDISI